MANFCKKLQSVCCDLRAVMFVLLFTFAATAAQAQQPTVNGRVVDRQGIPVVGASVIEQGTTNGTTTGVDGTYSLTIKGEPSGSAIQFQMLGFVTQTVSVSGRTAINVTLNENAITLDGVVAIGFGTVRQKDLTTAVSIVSTKDIDTRPITSASAALQGRAAGVQVMQPNGAPGEGMVVRIRGNSSIQSSNDPLYVVDDVPVGEGNYAIAFLSPNDIETIQVLKDASSAAIYGSRGANGVVLITTKSGNKKKGATINFSTYVGVSTVAKTFDVLNAQQYRELMEENGAIKGLPTDLKDVTDWFDETYSTGVNQNYQFSVSNADETSSYFIGGGYSSDKGIINTTSSNRYNVRANFDKQIFKWISANASIAYSRYNTTGNIFNLGAGSGSNRGGVVNTVITTPTYAPVWDPENPKQFNNKFYGANLTSPLENMDRNRDTKNITDRMILSGGLVIRLMEGLNFKSTITMDRRWVHYSEFLDPVRTEYGRNQHGSASESRSDDMRMVYDNILTWNKSYGLHNIEVMGGTSATTSLWQQLWGGRTYFNPENTIPNLNGGNNGGQRGQSTSKAEWSIMSYLARVSYNYDSRYLVSANFRADGSSKLAPAHRWGFFPSFSAAWRISGEKFLRDVQWISDLKLRGGWGQTGNQSGLAEYAALQQYNINYYDWTDPTYSKAVPTVGSKSNMKNIDLTWETTTQTNVGIDWSMFRSRLTISLDYYYKYTKDLLLTVPLPAPYPSILRNEGEMSNQGFEVSISSINIAKRDFRWSTDFNLSLNRNKLEKLTLQQSYLYGKTADFIDKEVIKMTPGQPLSKFWGYVSEGVDPETGDLIYRDLDGNGDITTSDQTWIGNANPKFTFGMTNNLSWKGLNLGFLITGSYGNDIFNAGRIETEGMYSGYNQTTEVLRRWRIPGQITDMPRATTDSYNVKNSTRWVEDGSYIKVKSITLSYDITSPKLRRVYITRIQPYVTLQNFLTFTNYSGYDPEVSQWGGATSMGIDWGTYPHVRTVVAGVNITF